MSSALVSTARGVASVRLRTRCRTATHSGARRKYGPRGLFIVSRMALREDECERAQVSGVSSGKLIERSDSLGAERVTVVETRWIVVSRCFRDESREGKDALARVLGEVREDALCRHLAPRVVGWSGTPIVSV